VQGQDEAVNFKCHLLLVDIGAQVAFFLGLSTTARFMAVSQVLTELASASRTGPGRSSNSTAPLM
jgi:hypothetical protein